MGWALVDVKNTPHSGRTSSSLPPPYHTYGVVTPRQTRPRYLDTSAARRTSRISPILHHPTLHRHTLIIPLPLGAPESTVTIINSIDCPRNPASRMRKSRRGWQERR
ncbi:hypothetical protein FJTKL_09317 [Diaporthe vaccinii]|uniref:Uncharacterized protein n=1 Tax=Diaporthe vaccinii TaxID=105482 RepID=A0ABR4FCQ8_9PEZI